MMRMIRTAHAWCGVLLAAFLAVIGLTGAACAFVPDLVDMTLPSPRERSSSPDSFGPALQAFQDNSAFKITFVIFDVHELGAHQLFLEGAESVFIDGRGEVLRRPSRPEELLVSLHQQLLLEQPGMLFVGAVGLGGAALGLSGLLVWLRGRPRLPAWPASLKRRDLLAAHRNWAGLLAAAILLQAATGSTTAFEGPLRFLAAKWEAPPPTEPPLPATDPDWTAIVGTARAAFPSGQVRQIAPPVAAGEPFRVRVRLPGEINPAGESYVDVAADGALVRVRPRASAPWSDRALNILVGLHTGQWLGPLARPLLALVGCGLALISLLGGWAFLTRPRRG